MTRIGADVVHVLHDLSDDADQILLDRRRYWWPHCETVWCVVLPEDFQVDQTDVPWCPKCFPTQSAITDAITIWHNERPAPTGREGD